MQIVGVKPTDAHALSAGLYLYFLLTLYERACTMKRQIKGEAAFRADKIHICYRRRGIISGEGNYGCVFGEASKKQRPEGIHSKARSLHQC